MGHFGETFNDLKKGEIVWIIKEKLRRAKAEGDNFLIYVRNPIKICLLLCELLDTRLKVGSHFSFLKHEVRPLTTRLIELAK